MYEWVLDEAFNKFDIIFNFIPINSAKKKGITILDCIAQTLQKRSKYYLSMKKDNKKWYHAIGVILEKLDMLGMPISVHFNQEEEVKAKIGGLFSIILYTIMSYVLVYLSIRVFRGNTFEISQTIIDANNEKNNKLERPFENTQFNIAYSIQIKYKDDSNAR